MEEEKIYPYVAVVTAQGDHGYSILMQQTDSGAKTLHTFDSGLTSPYSFCVKYLAALRKRLGINAHTTVIEEESFCEYRVSLVVVEVPEKCSVSPQYV